MKIAIIGANGKAGSLIVKEAMERGHSVYAITRGTNKTNANHVINKDVFDLTKEDIQSFDVVVDALGFWLPEDLPKHKLAITHLINLLNNTSIKLFVVGGAGSLYIDKSRTEQLMDTPDFPDSFKPLAKSMAEGLTELRKQKNINWVYISPAADFQFEGRKTGHYKISGEYFMTNSEGKSSISYADYAVGFLDVIESGQYNRERISLLEE